MDFAILSLVLLLASLPPLASLFTFTHEDFLAFRFFPDGFIWCFHFRFYFFFFSVRYMYAIWDLHFCSIYLIKRNYSAINKHKNDALFPRSLEFAPCVRLSDSCFLINWSCFSLKITFLFISFPHTMGEVEGWEVNEYSGKHNRCLPERNF